VKNSLTAILLAAGVGKRMGPDAAPKCLLAIGGKSLLQRTLESLRAVGVEEVALVTGFQAGAVAAEARAHAGGLKLTVLENPRYKEGAILSLWTAREFLDRKVLVMDADVLCPQAAFERLVGSPHRNCLLVDSSVRETGEEQMVFGREAKALHIAKKVPEEIRRRMELCGESLGFLRLDSAAAALLRSLLDRKVQAGVVTIEHDGIRQEWSQMAMNETEGPAVLRDLISRVTAEWAGEESEESPHAEEQPMA
jgi:choline kinase